MATHARKRKIFKSQLLLYLTGPNVTKFLLEPPWAEGIKIYTNPRGHMTNMATMSSHGKNLYKFLLLDQWIDCLEIWYVALDTGVLPRLFK